MIVYFADRYMNMLGHASNKLPRGLVVSNDLKTEDVETGVAVFECKIHYNGKNREKVERCAEVGNYILRRCDDKNEDEFYTIIDSEIDTKSQEITIYAEDAGLDLLNEVVGSYSATEAQPIDFYVNMFAYDSGFEIGLNEAAGLTRKLRWDGESTASERIASVATQFDNCEISYSFKVRGMEITHKYINIYKKRGKDDGIQLRLNKEIDRIITKKSIANLATALECTGGIPENSETPISLRGYKYDDGDFYVADTRVLSREAHKRWSRYIWTKEPNQITGQEGHIVRRFSYDTTSQETLCKRAIAKLKKIREIEVNYEVDISRLPENVAIGDRVNIIDDSGNLYLSTRVLVLSSSECDNSHTATLGEFLLKGSGISQRVEDLAKQFEENSYSAKRAEEIANAANKKADEAKQSANSALEESQNAQSKANEAKTAADNASQSAQEAKTAADNAQNAVDTVVSSVGELETAIENAQTAADNAKTAADTATKNAQEAKTAADNAKTEAGNATNAANDAKEAADKTLSKAESALSSAITAKVTAQLAKETAQAAKTDAKQALKDLTTFASNLDTVTDTMQVNYARKTELTETEATLQSQIDRNAAQIKSTVSAIWTVDETANNAAELAAQAQAEAAEAKTKADQAKAYADEAQTAANTARTAADAAQAEADTARAAADEAQSVAEKAEADLLTAKAELEEVLSREDATQEEIRQAQEAVAAAQGVLDKAQSDADAATNTADEAQKVANDALKNANDSQLEAEEALKDAEIAKEVSNKVSEKAAAESEKANNALSAAESAHQKADAAISAAEEAKATADAAVENAESAKATADTAKSAADDAQRIVDDAHARVSEAQSELERAQARYDELLGNADATLEELEEAKAAVDTAKAAADEARAAADAAQAEADIARAAADEAQTAADEAQTVADTALQAANEAQTAADEAQKEVDGLAVRTGKAESDIKQNAESIRLTVTKTEKAIYESSKEMNETILQQTTEAISTCEKIMFSALESYVETGNYNEFKTSIESQLSLLADKMELTFTNTTEKIDSVNEDLQNQLNQITTYFTFDIDGLTIGKVDNPYKIILSNERYSMQVNGVEVLWIDAKSKAAHIPVLTITERFIFFGYSLELDELGNVNCGYIGG